MLRLPPNAVTQDLERVCFPWAFHGERAVRCLYRSDEPLIPALTLVLLHFPTLGSLLLISNRRREPHRPYSAFPCLEMQRRCPTTSCVCGRRPEISVFLGNFKPATGRTILGRRRCGVAIFWHSHRAIRFRCCYATRAPERRRELRSGTTSVAHWRHTNEPSLDLDFLEMDSFRKQPLRATTTPPFPPNLRLSIARIVRRWLPANFFCDSECYLWRSNWRHGRVRREALKAFEAENARLKKPVVRVGA
jgi:hypothetical protein